MKVRVRDHDKPDLFLVSYCRRGAELSSTRIWYVGSHFLYTLTACDIVRTHWLFVRFHYNRCNIPTIIGIALIK